MSNSAGISAFSEQALLDCYEVAPSKRIESRLMRKGIRAIHTDNHKCFSIEKTTLIVQIFPFYCL
jgi:hypothetical protein